MTEVVNQNQRTNETVGNENYLIQIKNEITPLRPKDVLDVQELSRLIKEESQ
jgi:hypothetical protein